MPQPTGEGSISFGPGFFHDLGKRCKTCRLTEARCARRGKCCDACTHSWEYGKRYGAAS